LASPKTKRERGRKKRGSFGEKNFAKNQKNLAKPRLVSEARRGWGTVTDMKLEGGR